MSAAVGYRQLNYREALIYELAKANRRNLLFTAAIFAFSRADENTEETLGELTNRELIAYIVGDPA